MQNFTRDNAKKTSLQIAQLNFVKGEVWHAVKTKIAKLAFVVVATTSLHMGVVSELWLVVRIPQILPSDHALVALEVGGRTSVMSTNGLLAKGVTKDAMNWNLKNGLVDFVPAEEIIVQTPRSLHFNKWLEND